MRAAQVYAAVSEDMDTLTFGAPKLARHLMVLTRPRLALCCALRHLFPHQR